MTRGFSAMRETLHLEGEVDLGGLDRAGDRRRGAVMRRRGDREMALAAQQARGRVEADPAGARDVDFGPGVQVGEVLRRRRTGRRAPSRRAQLDEIAGHEARRQAEMAQDLHQQPAVSRHEPEPSASVSSGVCTPGSMRMT